MLHNVKELLGCHIHANDGEIGTVKDLYFDDERWVIRYLVVETGTWLASRRVLISPISVRDTTWVDNVMRVSLTQRQVKDSPDIDTDKPVCRQHEADYHNYYGYPNYWEGANLWGASMYPVIPWVDSSAGVATLRESRESAVAHEMQARLTLKGEPADPHLRSCDEVAGYEVLATDGLIGRVADFIFDDKHWAVRYIDVDTHRWMPGKHVLISRAWVDQVSWAEHQVLVDVTRKAVETGPAYEAGHPLTRQQEANLHEHHERAPYWPLTDVDE
ncbi:PRC-barrel domain-containing protein [Pandoraea sp.]|uniref:PRC-barrel domain containing protein n=1 Tax=Pandoraea sp. TaxID=1883445 RepID=UPI001212C401|nr:PRC-barrel domain-containing protein [Pandoraea sp.]TAL53501.1 MAG: PRC-barrel domain containing protein [Pandoraea sp.]TAM14957.1 MAG: PRC-barrel domain containing protein [Pandoraea sp.]